MSISRLQSYRKKTAAFLSFQSKEGGTGILPLPWENAAQRVLKALKSVSQADFLESDNKSEF